MMLDDSTERVRDDAAFCQKAIETLIPGVWESTVPIFVYVEGVFALHGTAMLLRIGEKSFLVCAAHVLLTARTAKFSLCVPEKAPKTGMVELLNGFKRLRTRSADGRDHLDVAVRELDEEEARLLDEYRFIRLSDVLTENWQGDDLYCVAGYSCDLSSNNRPGQKVISAHRLFCFARQRTDPSIDFPGYDSRYHLLLEGRRMGAVSLRGEQPLPLTFEGMSGAGIWKMNRDAACIDHWQPSHAKVVAVQTCASREAIRGTIWKAVATLIRDGFMNGSATARQ